MNHVYEATGDVVLTRPNGGTAEHYIGAAIKLEQTLPNLWQLSSPAFALELDGFDQVRVQMIADQVLHGPITSTGVGCLVFRNLLGDA